MIRSKLNLNKAEAVYLFVNNKVALRGGILYRKYIDMSIKEVYDKYQDDDKFLYIQYCEYNTFGFWFCILYIYGIYFYCIHF